MQMRTFLLRAFVLLLVALATESVRSDEEDPQVSPLSEEDHIEPHGRAEAKAKAPTVGSDTKTFHKENILVQFGLDDIGDALGISDDPSPTPAPAMPPAVPAYMPLEAAPGEVMPPIKAAPPPPPIPTPSPTEVWEATLPDPVTMDTMPRGYMPGETMPPPVLAQEDLEEKVSTAQGHSQGRTSKAAPKQEQSENMPPVAEDNTLLDRTLTVHREAMPPRLRRAERRAPAHKPHATRVQMARQLPANTNIWDINVEDDNPDWEPGVIQKRIVAGMPKVPVHPVVKAVRKTNNKGNEPLNLARKFGHRLQMFFQHIYDSARGVVWGEWTPKYAKYRSGIFSLVFALSVAIAPVLVLLFVTCMRFLRSKLKRKGNAPEFSDAEQQGLVEQSDALFYTSRMFPVD